MSSFSLIVLALCCAWASGINVYAVLLMLGLSSAFNHLPLPADLDVLTHPLVLFCLGFMYCVEFVADKIPGVDSLWDLLHTFIRIPLAVYLVGALLGEAYPDWQLVAQFIAIVLALASHLTKASSRVLINSSPEPFSNWAASSLEDILVFTGIWLALSHPVVFCLLLVCFMAGLIWLLPKIIRLVVSLAIKLRNWLTGRSLPT